MTVITDLPKNRLLRSLSAELLAELMSWHEYVPLALRDVIETADTNIVHVYFPERGLISVVASLPGNRPIEVGIVGHDGMTGTAIVQGDYRSPYESYVQIEGAAIRFDAERFRVVIAGNEALRKLLHFYVRAFGIQVSSTALANGRAKLEGRLARWLLMIRDRSEGERLEITHEFLSVMLGVRRPGVTVALQVLEGKGYIKARRGELQIIDRDGLIEVAEGSYGMAEAEYERLLGAFRPAEVIAA